MPYLRANAGLARAGLGVRMIVSRAKDSTAAVPGIGDSEALTRRCKFTRTPQRTHTLTHADCDRKFRTRPNNKDSNYLCAREEFGMMVPTPEEVGHISSKFPKSLSIGFLVNFSEFDIDIPSSRKFAMFCKSLT